jgi:hypothetical protein
MNLQVDRSPVFLEKCRKKTGLKAKPAHAKANECAGSHDDAKAVSLSDALEKTAR